MTKRIALTIAGSDSSGGAGIQADLKAFTALGVHGLTVVTCVTCQNTQHVKTIYKLPVDLVGKQIDVVLEDIKPDAVKTGMLYDEEIARCVVNKIKKYSLKIIVDPVLVATSGDKLARKNLVESIKNDLIPTAYMVTPNIEEASTLTGIKIGDVDDVRKACREIHKLGSKYVLIKGGHLGGKYVYDVLFDGGNYSVFSLPRISHKKAHGSGCTLSALITGLTALGEPAEVAVGKAKSILWSMIKKGYRPGGGADVLNVSSSVVQGAYSSLLDEAHFKLWLDLMEVTDRLFSFLSLEYIPEVGMNIGYALPDAKGSEDVCAIDGRIVKSHDKPTRCGRLDFGVSKHIASIILAAMSFNSEIRCAMNISYSEKSVERCKELGFKIGFFDRVNEPKSVKSTMEWGTKEVVKKLGYVPDIIFDKGGLGKEPMIRILGKNPKDVVEKALVLMKKA